MANNYLTTTHPFLLHKTFLQQFQKSRSRTQREQTGSVCPPGETVGKPGATYPGFDFSCGELDTLIGENPSLVCPVVERLTSWFQLKGYCECSGYDVLPDVCSLCGGDETRVRDNVIVILPDGEETSECPILFDLVRFVDNPERCPDAETEDACCRPAGGTDDPGAGDVAPTAAPSAAEDPDETDAPGTETEAPEDSETEAPGDGGDGDVEDFTKQWIIQDGKVVIDFKVLSDTKEIELTMTRDGEGWLAVGVSPDGLMVCSTILYLAGVTDCYPRLPPFIVYLYVSQCKHFNSTSPRLAPQYALGCQMTRKTRNYMTSLNEVLTALI